MMPPVARCRFSCVSTVEFLLLFVAAFLTFGSVAAGAAAADAALDASATPQLTIEQKVLRWARPERSIEQINATIEEIELNSSRYGVDSDFALAMIAAESSLSPSQAFSRQWSSTMQLRRLYSYGELQAPPVWDDIPNAVSTIRYVIDEVKNSQRYADRTLKSALEIYWMGPARGKNTDTFERFYAVFREKYKAILDAVKSGGGPSESGLPIIKDDLGGFESRLPRMADLDKQLRSWPYEDAYAQAVQNFNPRLGDKSATLIARAIITFSNDANIDPRLVMALVACESGFKPSATSPKGAMGLSQLMPATASSFGIRDPYEPVQNIWVCVRYLEREFYRFNGAPDQLDLVLAAYNAGAGAVKKYGGVPPYSETVRYVRKVKSLYRQLSG